VPGREITLSDETGTLTVPTAQVMPMEANPSTAHLYIVNPLRGASLVKLFSTHPPVEARVERLREIGRGMGAYF
jgi:Zn-dependent protease with chaperone function